MPTIEDPIKKQMSAIKALAQQGPPQSITSGQAAARTTAAAQEAVTAPQGGVGIVPTSTGFRQGQLQPVQQMAQAAQQQMTKTVAESAATKAQQQLNAQQQNAQLKALQQKQILDQREASLTEQTRLNKDRLFRLDAKLNKKLTEETMKFKRDELNRTHFNERQLADWAILQAKSDEDLANWQQQVQQVSDRKIQLLQTAHAKIQQALKQEYLKDQQSKDQTLMRKLAMAEAELRRKIAAEQAEASNRAGIWSAGASLIGAAASAVAVGFGQAWAVPVIMAGTQAVGALAEKNTK